MKDQTETKQSRDQQAMDAAAEWFAKRQGLMSSANDEEAFQRWLETDPSNALAYEQCKMLWQMSFELHDDKDIKQEIVNARTKDYLTGNSEKTSKIIPRLKFAAAIFLAVGIAFVTSHLMPDKYRTGIGEQRVVLLPDGSTAILNTNTIISVSFDADTRRIDLKQGESYFDVMPDSNRPFEVYVNQRVVRAIGTEFNVSVLDDEVSVAVLEGTVVVGNESNSSTQSPAFVEVEHGQTVKYLADSAISEVKLIDIERISAWRERKLYFKSDKLNRAVAEYNRYNDIKIKIIDDKIGDELISGIFNIDDTESFIFAIETAFNVYSIRNRDGIFLMLKKKQYSAKNNSG
jgi:transmembrane sensor